MELANAANRQPRRLPFVGLDGPDRDPMIARILAYWPPTDRYWPCHGHMDGGHLHIARRAHGNWRIHTNLAKQSRPIVRAYR